MDLQSKYILEKIINNISRKNNNKRRQCRVAREIMWTRVVILLANSSAASLSLDSSLKDHVEARATVRSPTGTQVQSRRRFRFMVYFNLTNHIGQLRPLAGRRELEVSKQRAPSVTPADRCIPPTNQTSQKEANSKRSSRCGSRNPGTQSRTLAERSSSLQWRISGYSSYCCYHALFATPS